MVLQTRPLNRFARTIAQTTQFGPRKVPFGSMIDEKFSGDNIPYQNFNGINMGKRKSHNCWTAIDKRKIRTTDQNKSSSRDWMVKILPIFSRPLATKIVIPKFSATTSKLLMIDGNWQWETVCKAWPLNQLITLLRFKCRLEVEIDISP